MGGLLHIVCERFFFRKFYRKSYLQHFAEDVHFFVVFFKFFIQDHSFRTYEYLCHQHRSPNSLSVHWPLKGNRLVFITVVVVALTCWMATEVSVRLRETVGNNHRETSVLFLRKKKSKQVLYHRRVQTVALTCSSTFLNHTWTTPSGSSKVAVTLSTPIIRGTLTSRDDKNFVP